MNEVNIKDDPELLELLEAAKGHVMTQEEKDAQRHSWVRGEMAMGNDADERRYRESIDKAEGQ